MAYFKEENELVLITEVQRLNVQVQWEMSALIKTLEFEKIVTSRALSEGFSLSANVH